MFIEIKDGIVTTSEGQSFRKSDIYQVTLEVKDVKSKLFIDSTIDKIDQKVFYEQEHDYGGGTHWIFKPENSDLRFAIGQQEEIEKIIDNKNYESRRWYTKTAAYSIFDKNNIKMGIHKFSKSYEDRMYLLAQWVMVEEDIKDLSVQLLTENKKRL